MTRSDLPPLYPRKNERLRKRLLFILSTIAWISITFIALYFKFFPTIISPVSSDIFIVALIFVLLLSLILGSFMILYPKDIILLMPQCLLICFFARSVRALRLSYPPLWDPYAFLATFLNIHTFGTLEPMYSYWETVIVGLINWPSMLILTESLSRVAGIDYMWLFNYQEPILGIIFFLGIFMMAYHLSKNYGVALLAGLISSLASHVIFYQSEYHYQGYAFIIFVFLLVSLLKTCENRSHSAYKILAVIFTMACAFSHYFSSLFILFILGVFFCFVNINSVFNKSFPNSRLNFIMVNNPDNLFFIILFVVVISCHIFIYPKSIERYIDLIFTADPYHVSLLTGGKGGEVVPFPTNLIHSIRYVVLLLGFTSIFYAIQKKKSDEIIIGIICMILVFFGFFGNTLIYLEVGRIVAFYEVLIGIFAALTLFRLRNLWLRAVKNQKLITATLCIVTAGIVTLTFFGGHYVPAYYFKSLDQSDYYWCNNDLPEMQDYKNVGTWISTYTPENSYFVSIDRSEYFIHSAIFFWGHVSSEKYIANHGDLPKNLNEPRFTLSNQRDFDLGKKMIIDVTNKLYCNGEVEMTTY